MMEVNPPPALRQKRSGDLQRMLELEKLQCMQITGNLSISEARPVHQGAGLAPSLSPLSLPSSQNSPRAYSAAFPSPSTLSSTSTSSTSFAEDAGSGSPPLPPKSRLRRSLSPPPLTVTRPQSLALAASASDLNNPNPKLPAAAAAVGASPDTSPDTSYSSQLPPSPNVKSHSHEALTLLQQRQQQQQGRRQQPQMPPAIGTSVMAKKTANAGRHQKDSVSVSLHPTQSPRPTQPSSSSLITSANTTHTHARSTHPHTAPAASNNADATPTLCISNQPPQLPPFSFFDANVDIAAKPALAPSHGSTMPFQNSQPGFSTTTVTPSDRIPRRKGHALQQQSPSQNQVPGMGRTAPVVTDSRFVPKPNPNIKKPDGFSHPQPSVPQMQTQLQSLDDGRRSVCQSPTWEAYESRKKDKEASKPRKRRLSKNRPANASSSRPSSSAGPSPSHLAQSKTDSSVGVSSSHDPRPGSRALNDPDSNSGSRRRSRSRSGSLSSLFRVPFEVRRSSIDIPSHDQGFVGGIKLEQQRLAAHQKALDESLFLRDGEIHPAFCKNERRSPSPLRFPLVRSEPKDQQKRFYPPISIRTTSRNQGLYDPEEPPVPEMGKINRWKAKVGLKGSRDETEPKRKDEVRRLSKPPPSAAAQEDGANKITAAISAPAINALPSWDEVSSSVQQQKMQGSKSTNNVLEATQRSPENSWDIPADQGQLPVFAPKVLPDGAVPSPRSGKGLHVRSNSESTGSTADTIEGPSNGYETAPSSPPPPPRRSSKRKSLISLNDLDGYAPGETQTAQSTQSTPAGTPTSKRFSMSRIENEILAPAPVMSKAAKRLTISDPPSIPYNSLYADAPSPGSNGKPPKRTFKEGVKATFARHTHRPTTSENLKSPYIQDDHNRSASMSQIQPTNAQGGARVTPSKVSRVLGESDSRTGHVMPTYRANSSDDSGSDGFQSPSAPSTPDTSRPQSERNVYALSDPNHDGKLMNGYQPYSSNLPSPALSTHESNQFTSNHVRNVELDPIQAAAMKVMVAFPDTQTPRPSFDRRSNSDTNLVSQVASLPKLQQGARSRNTSKAPSIRTNMGGADDTKTPPLRDLIMSKDTSSVAAPWPASYLEAARKAAPAAPKPTKAGSSAAPSIKGSAAPSIRSQYVSSVALPPGDPIAKMFVECCACKYYHDMPSKLYEAMANPEGVVPPEQSMGFSGALSMTVKCPWCKHEMSTKCCAGLAAMVYIKERLH